MHLLGYPIAILGVVLMIIGVFGAAAAIAGERGKGFAGAAGDTIASVLKELPKLIDSLAKAPKWLSMLLMGLLLVWAGDRLSAGAWPFS
jgi:hypothetical protein